MEEEKILDESYVRKYIAFMLNNQFDTNINADNIKLSQRPKQSRDTYSYYIGIELGNRLPIKPLFAIIDPISILISYIKKNTKDGYEFNELENILSYIDATEFFMEEFE
jgi:hypothetical protein